MKYMEKYVMYQDFFVLFANKTKGKFHYDNSKEMNRNNGFIFHENEINTHKRTR